MSNIESIIRPAARRAMSQLSLAKQREPISEHALVWWLLTGCLILGNIQNIAPDIKGPAKYVVAFGSSAGCAWMWLFARTLFRPSGAFTKWPLALLGVTIFIEGLWSAWPTFPGPVVTNESLRLLTNAAEILCIGMLALVLVETLSGIHQQTTQAEKRFRQIFAGAFVMMIGFVLLWSMNAPEGTFAASARIPLQFSAGLVAIFGGRAAVVYRNRHPLKPPRHLAVRPRATRISTPDNAILADRIRKALEYESFFATPQLKVSDLSKALGEHEYKVSQCITGVMGYQNFNRLVNDFRIAHAKAALKDHTNINKQILSIALECGFNSIGPFNRAFKQEVGTTPRQYRAEQL